HADRMPWMQQPARHVARGAQDERIAAGRIGPDETELQVIHLRELADLGEVAAQQREMMALVHVADLPQALHRGLVADVAAERVTRVRRIRDHSTTTDDVDRRPDEPRL